MRNPIQIIILSSLLFALTACGGKTVYTHFDSIPSEQWHKDSAQVFTFDIKDTASLYQILINVRHTDNYPYQNMWLFVSDSLTMDTIEFYLADDRGRWLGNGRNGLIDMSVLYEEAYHFPHTGTYSLSVEHGMRDSLLRGIADVGLEINRVEQDDK